MTTDKAAAPVGAVPQGDDAEFSAVPLPEELRIEAALLANQYKAGRLRKAADLIEKLSALRRHHRAKHKSYKRRFREAEAALASQAARMGRAEATLERIADMYDDHRAQFEQRQDAYDMADIARTYLAERDA